MQTFKTAVVVVLLLLLLYGVYIVLSKPEAQRAATDLARHLASSSDSAPEPSYESMGDPWSGGPPGGPSVSIAGAPDMGSGSNHADIGPSTYGAGPSSVAPAGNTTAALEGYTTPPAPGGPHDMHAHGSSSRGPDSAADRTGANSGRSSAARLPRDPGPNSLGDGRVGRQGATNADNLGTQAFDKAMRTAQSYVREGQYRDALYTVSIFYNSPDLEPGQHSDLLDLLDPLAGEVVYSTKHLLESAYEVRRNETLFDIAQRYQVPWQLLKNINDVRNPQVLVPGTRLKVVPGPFRAEVDMQRGELTVFLGRLYAGRFPVTLGKDPAPQSGTYEIRDKRSDRAYYGSDGVTIAPDDPRNPFGGFWLDMGREMSIHGSAEQGGASNDRLGCISLSPGDARDVYGILSVGSKVVVRR